MHEALQPRWAAISVEMRWKGNAMRKWEHAGGLILSKDGNLIWNPHIATMGSLSGAPGGHYERGEASRTYEDQSDGREAVGD